MLKNKIYVFLAVISLGNVSLEAMWPFSNNTKNSIVDSNSNSTQQELISPASASTSEKSELQRNISSSEDSDEDFEDLYEDEDTKRTVERDKILWMLKKEEEQRPYETDSEADDSDIEESCSQKVSQLVMNNVPLKVVLHDAFENPFHTSDMNLSGTEFWNAIEKKHTPVRNRIAKKIAMIKHSLATGNLGSYVLLKKDRDECRLQKASGVACATTFVEKRFVDIEPQKLSIHSQKNIAQMSYNMHREELMNMKQLCDRSIKTAYCADLQHKYQEAQKVAQTKKYPSFQEMSEGRYAKVKKDKEFLNYAQEYLSQPKQASSHSYKWLSSLASLWFASR